MPGRRGSGPWAGIGCDGAINGVSVSVSAWPGARFPPSVGALTWAPVPMRTAPPGSPGTAPRPWFRPVARRVSPRPEGPLNNHLTTPGDADMLDLRQGWLVPRFGVGWVRGSFPDGASGAGVVTPVRVRDVFGARWW
ncbi:hypothetical protein GCM10023223_26090 [Stackebrandtia albiflava]